MPFRWPNTWHDLMLVTEVAAKHPKKSSEWDEIAEILSPHFSKEKEVHLTGRACRDRLSRLIDKYLEEDKKALKRSGSEEEYTELHQLLEDIYTFRKDMEELYKREKENKKEREKIDCKKGEQMREAAMKGMSKQNCENTSSSDEDSLSGESSISGGSSSIKRKKAAKKYSRKRGSKLSAIEMLQEKNKSKASLKEKELEQRKLELDFEKQKYEDQAREREQRLSMELEERRMFLSLLKDKI